MSETKPHRNYTEAGVEADLLRENSHGLPQQAGNRRGPLLDIATQKEKSLFSLPSGMLRPKIPFFLLTFILFVVIPSFGSAIYFAWIASDQYVAEARFAIRANPASKVLGEDLKSALSSGGSALGMTSTGSQDSHIVAQYLRSRAAIEDTMKSIDLRSVYTRSGTDFLAKLKINASIEELETYWRSMVSVTVDGPSGIVSLYVNAFTPQEAKSIAESLIKSSEILINRLSERARHDGLSRAEADVIRAEGMMRKALLDLKSLRDEKGMLDPTSAATGTAQLLLQLMGERIRLQNEISVISQSLSPTAPTLVNLRAQLEAVDGQITELRSSMTSTAQASTISNFLLQFEGLEIQRIFSEKNYLLAQNALERARVKAEQKQLYLTVFLPPSIPEEARYPERLLNTLILPFVFFIFWGIFALICAAIDDHRI